MLHYDRKIHVTKTLWMGGRELTVTGWYRNDRYGPDDAEIVSAVLTDDPAAGQVALSRGEERDLEWKLRDDTSSDIPW